MNSRCKHFLPFNLICFAAFFCLLYLSNIRPLVAEEVKTQENDWHYTLRPSDSFHAVAKSLLDNKHNWGDLVRYNRIEDVSKLAAGSIIRVPIDWLKQQPKPASVLSTTGSVLIKKSREAQYKVLRPNMAILVGDEVSTRKGSALIKFADGSVIRLEEESTLIFNKLSHYGDTGMVDTRMRLKKGSISTEVKPLIKGSRYEISTPSAVAAVRGTKFRLHTSEQGSKIEVTEGTVEFSHEHGSTVVQAGEGARVSTNSALINRVKLTPAPAPQFANTVTDLPAKLTWKGKAPAEQYRFELRDQNSDGEILQNKTLNKPEVELDNVGNGDYSVAMRAVDDQGFEGLDANSELSVRIEAVTAKLLAPLDGSILDADTPLFSWQLEDDTVLGKLQISSDELFENLHGTFKFSGENSAQPQQALAPGQYFWRVTTLGDNSQEHHSDSRKFSIRGQLPAVKILSVNYLESQVGLFWNTVKHANGYILQVSDSKRFDNILKEETLGKASAHLKLTPGKTYYARIKAIGNELYRSEYGPTKELLVKE